MGRYFTRYNIRNVPFHVLRQKTTLFFCLFLVIPIFGITLPFSSTLQAASTGKEKQKLEEGINRYRINIQRLQEGIKLQQEELKHSLSQEKDLLTQLEDLDTRLGQEREKLKALQDRMNAQQDLITIKEKELERVRHNKDAVQLHLQKRLSAYYKMGRIGLINVAFSAQTLPELLSFHDSFQTLIRYDQNLIETYRHSIDELERAKKAYTLEKSLLQEFIAQEEDEKSQLDATILDKKNLLALIRTKTKLHQQALKEMKDASENLTSSLVVMQKKEQILDQRFLLNRGKLTPPVDGTVVTLFNQVKTNRLGITSKSKGIAITAPDGTKVKAIFDGMVLYAGYVRGYGNTIIVDHGYQYYSIISRVEKLLVRTGDKVKTGDVIAVMGDTATLIDDGLYLEIRHGKQVLDPLKWLDTNHLTISAAETSYPTKD